jgi:hypothetical protein
MHIKSLQAQLGMQRALQGHDSLSAGEKAVFRRILGFEQEQIWGFLLRSCQ